VVQAIEQSCDVFFYHVGLRLGVDRIAKYAKAGGLGARTGIDLDHESSGLIPTAAWKKKKKRCQMASRRNAFHRHWARL
jgi:penicillin-binding protein 2